MSPVDITPVPAEDELMDPATKRYVDSNVAVAEARNDVKLAVRATMEAYSARAEERESAARQREAAAREHDEIRHKDLDRRMAQFEETVASVKRAVVTTGIAATVSTVFGVAAFNAALIKRQLAEERAARVR